MTLSHPPNTPNRGATSVLTPAAKGSARYTKADRLRQRSDFLRAQAQGKRFYRRHFGVIVAPPAAAVPRLGLVVTRRLGKAARRNRVKRLLREFFRRHKWELPIRDLIILAKKEAIALNYRQVEDELGRLLLKKTWGKDANHD